MTPNSNHIFVDTNILIGAFAGARYVSDKKCLDYLLKLRGRKLFISSLSIAQFIATFQKRKAPYTDICRNVSFIQSKFYVRNFTEKEINEALALGASDIEDAIQHIIGRKAGCMTFVTNNEKDFRRNFLDIDVFPSNKIRRIDQ